MSIAKSVVFSTQRKIAVLPYARPMSKKLTADAVVGGVMPAPPVPPPSPPPPPAVLKITSLSTPALSASPSSSSSTLPTQAKVNGTPSQDDFVSMVTDDGEGNEVGPGLTFTDNAELRRNIPNPNGIPGEVVELDGKYKILFLESIIDRLKDKMKSYMYVFLNAVATVSGLKAVTTHESSELESVVTSAHKAFQQGLEEARRNLEASSLTSDTKRANALILSGQMDNNALDQATREILDEVYTTSGGYEKDKQNVLLPKTKDLNRLPPVSLSQMVPGLPVLDLTSKEALVQWALKTGRLDKTLLEALVILFPETKKEELSLNYLLNADSSGFTVVSPQVTGQANLAADWLKRELETDSDAPQAHLHADGRYYFTEVTLTPEILAKTYPVKYGNLVGCQILESTLMRGMASNNLTADMIINKLKDARVDMLGTLTNRLIVATRTDNYHINREARLQQRAFDRQYPPKTLGSQNWRN